MMNACLTAIEYYLPEQVLTNDQLAAQFPDWTADRIEQKLGIVKRHISAESECSSDLGVKAAQKLFATGACAPSDIDFVLFCTQSPDYFLPTTACLVQHRLGIPDTAGALDFNLGCSGYVYGLSLAKGLVESGQCKNLLLITAETYSKFLHPEDKSVRTIFGDAATASLIRAGTVGEPGSIPPIGPFVLGTDGRGAENLIVEAGGSRKPNASGQVTIDEHGNPKSEASLYMNGSEIFTFTLNRVPRTVQELLKRSGLRADDIDLFVFHQANGYILDFLRKACRLPEKKFYIGVRDFGNTVSSTIPIALKNAAQEGRLTPGARVMMVGFGVGYSWGAALVKWQPPMQ